VERPDAPCRAAQAELSALGFRPHSYASSGGVAKTHPVIRPSSHGSSVCVANPHPVHTAIFTRFKCGCGQPPPCSYGRLHTVQVWVWPTPTLFIRPSSCGSSVGVANPHPVHTAVFTRFKCGCGQPPPCSYGCSVQAELSALRSKLAAAEGSGGGAAGRQQHQEALDKLREQVGGGFQPWLLMGHTHMAVGGLKEQWHLAGSACSLERVGGGGGTGWQQH